MTVTGPLTSGQRDWLRVRSYLAEHRYDLGLAAAESYPAGQRVAGTPLLSAPGWRPAAPVPLDQIALELTEPPGAADLTDAPAGLRPERPDGTRYRRYSDAVADLGAPATFENRSTYRLTEAALASGAPRLAFTRGHYFDGIDTGEAAAHEFAAAQLEGRPTSMLRTSAPPTSLPRTSLPSASLPPAGLPPAGLRAAVGDPCDLRRRPANLAITTLTLRHDPASGRASFLLHWRDPAKVGHAGGLYQVIPVGIFQPSGPGAASERADFSLWRGMVREFDEELRGHSEIYSGEEYDGPIDYDAWPFARQLTEALASGRVRAWCLGLGTDPLTWATDLLTVVVIDRDLFDQLFSLAPRPNDEGRVLAARDFAPHVIDRIVSREPVQAAGAATLRLAWTHRDVLTG